MESLGPQLISAGRIRLNYPANKAADEHFDNLQRQYAESMQKVRDLVDAVTDSGAFIKASGNVSHCHIMTRVTLYDIVILTNMTWYYRFSDIATQ